MRKTIEGEFNIYTATTWKEQLLPALLEPGDPELDLSAVNEFDSAGLQILLLLRRETQALGKELTLRAPSRCVLETLQLCHVAAGFTLIAGEPMQDAANEIDGAALGAHADRIQASGVRA